ncbi:MAG TPA: LysM peptidoglycan-binding domain-containing protein [Dissulfurispiraceae bacterium]|nr:LysM peptidoglycan-binding domain-containing protein [Dissulfurispiraceae bacterium]
MTVRCNVSGMVKSLLLLGLVFVPAVLYADSSSSDKAYTVKKGDTLWGISSEKFSNPYQWKRIWKANPFIRNPHWIYPGQKLVLPEGLGDGDLAGRGDGSMLRVTPKPLTPKPVPIQKADRLASRQDFLSIGYISTTPMIAAGKVLDMSKDRTIVANGDHIYITTVQPAEIGKRFYVYATPEEIKHPVTNERVGDLIRIKGVIEIVLKDNESIRGLVVEAWEEIRKDDDLGPYYHAEAPYFVGVAGKPVVNGVVLRTFRQKDIGGTFEAVYLDKGIRDGLRMGDIVDVFSARGPKAFIGTIQIINVTEGSAAAVVKKSNSEILLGDAVKN